MQKEIRISPVNDYAECPIHGRKIYAADEYVSILRCDFCGEIIKYVGCMECEDVPVRKCSKCGNHFCRECGSGFFCDGCTPEDSGNYEPWVNDIDYSKPEEEPEKENEEEITIKFPDNDHELDDDGSLGIDFEDDVFTDFDLSDYSLGDSDVEIESDSGDCGADVDYDTDVDYDFGDWT